MPNQDSSKAFERNVIQLDENYDPAKTALQDRLTMLSDSKLHEFKFF